MYSGVHTDFDVMKEFLIEGCELDGEYGIPMLPASHAVPTDTVDFAESFSRKIKNHRKLTVNFYICDAQFTRLFNNPDKYLGHLICFHLTIAPDFSIATGEHGMPFALNLYNHWRNHALAFYLAKHGIEVIPSVSLCGIKDFDWCLSGLPRKSTLAVCTNGRVRSKAVRMEFCEAYYEMCRRLKPLRMVIVGHVPEELKSPVEVISLKSRNQQMNERFQTERG